MLYSSTQLLCQSGILYSQLRGVRAGVHQRPGPDPDNGGGGEAGGQQWPLTGWSEAGGWAAEALHPPGRHLGLAIRPAGLALAARHLRAQVRAAHVCVHRNQIRNHFLQIWKHREGKTVYCKSEYKVPQGTLMFEHF